MHDDSDGDFNGLGHKDMNVMSPGGIFNTGIGNSTDSVVMKELRNKLHCPEACAQCSARRGHSGSNLIQYARCKDRKYCSSVCQKKHWKIHKSRAPQSRLEVCIE
ncbi:metal ion binding [Ascochyta rabiei]|uniref:Metal ion binding n=1 Tax=Didymella rabiei TaxID=5454 RepID=A0A163DWC9_DIDRA|nr:metal ion binding [Ascochyta rabiei]